MKNAVIVAATAGALRIVPGAPARSQSSGKKKLGRSEEKDKKSKYSERAVVALFRTVLHGLGIATTMSDELGAQRRH